MDTLIDNFVALFAVTDLACALLPLFFIVKIRRPLREKVVLFLLMAMGLLACACGIVKTALLRGILRSKDPVWEGASVTIWTSVDSPHIIIFLVGVPTNKRYNSYAEEYIGITAANIPCIKSLLETAFHKFGGHVTTMTSSNSKFSLHDQESFPPPDQSSIAPLSKKYKTYPTRMEEDPVGYHASLRETSRLKRLERPAKSEEDVLLKLKREMRESTNHGFEFDFMGDEKREETFVARQVRINGRRVDRHNP